MSIAVLTQVYDEARRLAIAGSVVAPGDFRLKKLIPALEQAGAKAPVFSKAADAVKAVVDADEKNSATALLELTALVSAILYTQGETGAAGSFDAIETTDLGMHSSQASARVLKPLLEALTTTGSGRFELIRDAFERGAFRDLRLVKPALDAIDDPFGEIGELVAAKILPLYGKAILPGLRSSFDPKGRGGHPRRLRLMHALDSAGTRGLVKEVLDSGSKEVKVVAIECLGADPDDLSFLVEQSTAKAQDVRQAAYRALASIDHDDAVEILKKAASGKDLELAEASLQTSRNAKVLAFLLAESEREIAALPAAKDRKEVSSKAGRIRSLLNCLFCRDDKDSEAFVLKVFAQRDALTKIKGDTLSGADVNAMVIRLMQEGTPKLKTILADTHGSLGAEELAASFSAARHAYPAAKVFEMFSPYLSIKEDEKKKKHREAVISAIEGRRNWHSLNRDQDVPLDPRWLDIAVRIRNLNLVRQLVRPGHAAANRYLKGMFDETLKKASSLDQCHEVVAAMVAAEHPDATDAFLAAFEKHGKKASYFSYWFAQLVPDLPKAALPRLEALLPTLTDRMADSLLGYIEQLRMK